MWLKTNLRRLLSDTSGQFTVWTALLALPITLSISFVFDLQTLNGQRTALKSALDSAAIAAVTNQNLNPEERSKYAKERFWVNLNDHENVKVAVPKSEGHRVEMEAKMQIPTLMASIIGKDVMTVEAFSATELTKGATVCMLTLDQDTRRSFEVTEGAVLDASTCGVQVNSIHREASVVDLGGQATAKSFCIAGGALGEHLPYANSQCSLLGNPYENLDIPDPGTCKDPAYLQGIFADWRSHTDAVDYHNLGQRNILENAGAAFTPTYFNKIELEPGNYCSGIELNARELIFKPGVYHITNGHLVFGAGTQIAGKDVTFVLHGKSRLEIRDGSSIKFKAPSSGRYAGLVFVQDVGNEPAQSTKYPNVKSTITSGGNMTLIGTVYLPTHKIEFMGGSLSDTQAPATSFIAHHISIRDGAKIGVAVDHTATDIPPILPRSDDGARIVE